MDFLILLFFGWIVWSIIKAGARQAGNKPTLPPPAPFYDVSQVPPEHMIRLRAAPVEVLAGRPLSEESSSELMWDEEDAAQPYGTAALAGEPVSLEVTDVAVPPPPAPPVVMSLEADVVDWESEHERFHQRYVDVRPADATPARGLLDELHDPASLRRALVLSEILGPPRALREAE